MKMNFRFGIVILVFIGGTGLVSDYQNQSLRTTYGKQRFLKSIVSTTIHKLKFPIALVMITKEVSLFSLHAPFGSQANTDKCIQPIKIKFVGCTH